MSLATYLSDSLGDIYVNFHHSYPVGLHNLVSTDKIAMVRILFYQVP